MPNTSVSLDPESAQLAQRMKREGKNFSRFVRECLFIYYAEEQETCTDDQPWVITHPDETITLCRPSRRYPCRKCWPQGVPHQEHWKQARAHCAACADTRAKRITDGPVEPRLIDALYFRDEQGVLRWEDEIHAVAWLKEKAEEANRFIMPLADLEIEGNASGPRKKKRGIVKRMLNFLW